MYSKVGGKIKVLAIVEFILGVIVSIATGFLLGSASGQVSSYMSYSRSSSFSWGIFILVVVVGFILSWLSSLFIYGYGQLIEDTHEIKQMIETNKSDAKQPSNVPQAAAPRANAPQINKTSTIICPRCGHEQSSDLKVCSRCKAPIPKNLFE